MPEKLLLALEKYGEDFCVLRFDFSLGIDYSDDVDQTRNILPRFTGRNSLFP